jgi:hypothetical protein
MATNKSMKPSGASPCILVHKAMNQMPATPIDTPDDALTQPAAVEAIRRGIITVTDRRVKSTLAK